MTQFSRQALWNWLDAHQLPFRTPVAQLVEQFGTAPDEWRTDTQVLHLPTQPALLPELVALPAVTLHRGAQLTRPARSFTCYIRTHDDAPANIDVALPCLTRQFGPPTHTVRNNAITHEWVDPTDATCAITLRGFPRATAINTGRNDRHATVPGGATEASITISPDYDPPLTLAEAKILADLQPVMDPQDQAHLSQLGFGLLGHGFDRAAPAAPIARGAGLWVTPDDVHFVALSKEGRFVIFTRGDIAQVVLDIAKPAKGSGGAGIMVELKQHGQSRSIGLCRDRFDAPYMPALAQRMAARFGQVLKTWDYFDC